MGSDLFLRVLGPLRLEQDGHEIDVGGARQREVLARLAVADGHPVSAEALVSDVWGPAATDSTAASLHVSVSKLRRAIDPDRRARAASPLASATAGYALAVDTDAAEVERRVRRAADLLDSGDLDSADAELEQARTAWRGEPFEGVGEHSWLVLERRRCEELRLYVAQLSAEASLRLGRNAAGVVVDLTGLVERYPAHEKVAVLLAVALYREQRQEDALRVLRTTREHLRDESGLDPGDELQRTEQLILAHGTDPYSAPAAPSPAPAARAAPAAPVAPDRSAPGPGRGYPLVGRGRPRAVLDAAAEAAGAGRPTAALLVGEGGIGKTRLARTLTDDLVTRGWRAVWARGTEDDGAPALWPWLSIVRQLGEVVPLVPELEVLVTGRVPGAGPASGSGSGTEPAADRWQQTQRIGELVEAATTAAPLVLVLDDLQWTDAASQSLLTGITARSGEYRMLLLVTSRPGGSATLTATLAAMARLGAIRLDLEGLTEGDVRALAAGAGLDVSARALRERTGGNPFLLQETLAFAAETGAPPLDVVPASVADVLGARMARLPAPGEELLLVASVLGSVAEPTAIARLAELDPGQVDEGLESALAAGLLRAGAEGTIRFRHDLVRETAYGRVGAVRRSRLHARALSLLVESGGGNPAMLAAHARAAGPALADEAVRWSMAAATEAAARHAPDSALQWWRAAYDADRAATVPDAVRRAGILRGLVRAQLDAGDAVGAIEARAEAVRAATEIGDHRLLTEALTALDRSLVWLPRPMGRVNPEMVRHLETALLTSPPPSPADRCMLQATLAIEIYSPTEQVRCEELTAEALQTAEGLDDVRRLAFALNARIAATAFPGRERGRAEDADRLVELGRRSGLPTVELAGHQFACRLRLQLFEVRAADVHAGEARRLADELRLPLPALQQRLWDCSRRALSGDVDSALRMVEEVTELDWPWWGREAMLATVRLTLLLRADSLADVEPLLDLAAAVHPGIAADARAIVVAGGSGSGGARLSDATSEDWAWLSSRCIHARAAIAAGDPAVIRATYDGLLPGSGMIASTGSFDAGPVDGYLADLAHTLGRADDERHHRELLAQLSAREGLTTPQPA